jgi:hypothetical protein
MGNVRSVGYVGGVREVPTARTRSTYNRASERNNADVAASLAARIDRRSHIDEHAPGQERRDLSWGKDDGSAGAAPAAAKLY